MQKIKNTYTKKSKKIQICKNFRKTKKNPKNLRKFARTAEKPKK